MVSRRLRIGRDHVRGRSGQGRLLAAELFGSAADDDYGNLVDVPEFAVAVVRLAKRPLRLRAAAQGQE